MANTSPETECTAVTIREPKVVFNRLASAIGEAVVAGREVGYVVHFETLPYTDPGPMQWFGGVILQTVTGKGSDRLGMQLRVYNDGKGTAVYSERATHIHTGDLRAIIRGITCADDPTDELPTDTVLDRAQTIINASPISTRTPPEWRVSSNEFGMVALSSARFVPILGNILALADRVPYLQVAAGANTARQHLLGRHRRTHLIRAATYAQNGTALEFELAHSHSDPYRAPQAVGVECAVAITPGKANPEILRAYDRLQGDSEMPPGRIRTLRRSETPQSNEVISHRPIKHDDILKLASSMLHPEAYLADFWSNVPSK